MMLLFFINDLPLFNMSLQCSLSLYLGYDTTVYAQYTNLKVIHKHIQALVKFRLHNLVWKIMC